MRKSSQSATEYSLLLKKTFHRKSKTLTPLNLVLKVQLWLLTAKALIVSPKTENKLSFVSPYGLSHLSWFQGLNIFHHLYSPQSQIMTLCQFFWKSNFLCHCSFTQLSHHVIKFGGKSKKFVIQIFWCVQHVGTIS